VTQSRAVFDASVVLRAVTAESSAALSWVRRAESGEVHAIVPELLFAECAHALLRYVRACVVDRRLATEQLRLVTSLRLDVRAHSLLVGVALLLALERDLSAYDACYVAIAEAEQAILVTADRRLAERSAIAELVA